MKVWVLMWWFPGFAGDEDCNVFATEEAAWAAAGEMVRYEAEEIAGYYDDSEEEASAFAMYEAVKEHVSHGVHAEADSVYSEWMLEENSHDRPALHLSVRGREVQE